MKILVFDTCLDKMYVTLAEDDKILSSKIVTNKYHSAFLISTIKELLKANNLTPQNIDAIGTNIGPGSFTGIRACTTVARMFAQQLNIPAVGISSLEILSKINNTEKTVLTYMKIMKLKVLFNWKKLKNLLKIMTTILLQMINCKQDWAEFHTNKMNINLAKFSQNYLITNYKTPMLNGKN